MGNQNSISIFRSSSSSSPNDQSSSSFKTSKNMNSLNFEWEYFDIYLDLSERGLGISIRGGIDSPNHAGFQDIYISRILQAGAVALDGRIRLGDIIDKVNGESLENVTHKEAVNIILSAGQYIHFHMKRRKFIDSSELYEQIAEDADENDSLIINHTGLEQFTNFDDGYNSSDMKAYNNCIKIELTRNINGFGFSVIGGLDEPTRDDDPGLYVNKIIENGPAHRDGRINIGDEIVAINDLNLECLTHQQALNIIRNSPPTSVFTIRKTIDWD